MAAPVWTPSAARAQATQLARFAEYVSTLTGKDLSSYPDLWRWSTEAADEFWPALWHFFDVKATRLWDTVVTDGDRMPGVFTEHPVQVVSGEPRRELAAEAHQIAAPSAQAFTERRGRRWRRGRHGIGHGGP